ncbi:MAG: hypothetical protein V7L21_15190 [Nostoc sp.]
MTYSQEVLVLISLFSTVPTRVLIELRTSQVLMIHFMFLLRVLAVG